jgi:redox-sensitive bicupin YhaK (pirin superfamily)
MRVYNPVEVPVGNATVLQPIPQGDIKDGDPFLLLHHAEKKTVKPGHGFHVGPHPHRGFQPVTFVFDGEVHHKDSLGNDSLVKTNGVQWISSGSGLMHSEGMSKHFLENGGDFEMIQLWINLKQEDKMTSPTYIGANESDMGMIETANSKIYVVSGEFNGIKGPVPNLSNVSSAMVKSNGNDELNLAFNGNTKMIYVLSGNIEMNGNSYSKLQLIQMDDEESVHIKITSSTRLLVLGGDKINEPIKAWGPYVMNTQTEIMEALRDFQMGKMGYLTE